MKKYKVGILVSSGVIIDVIEIHAETPKEA